MHGYLLRDRRGAEQRALPRLRGLFRGLPGGWDHAVRELFGHRPMGSISGTSGDGTERHGSERITYLRAGTYTGLPECLLGRVRRHPRAPRSPWWARTLARPCRPTFGAFTQGQTVSFLNSSFGTGIQSIVHLGLWGMDSTARSSPHNIPMLRLELMEALPHHHEFIRHKHGHHQAVQDTYCTAITVGNSGPCDPRIRSGTGMERGTRQPGLPSLAPPTGPTPTSSGTWATAVKAYGPERDTHLCRRRHVHGSAWRVHHRVR
jgi:hypothetical protein